MTANSAPTNIGVVNLIYSLPTLIADNLMMESNGPRKLLAMYANFMPCKPNFIINARTAKTNGITPIAKTSSNLISN